MLKLLDDHGDRLMSKLSHVTLRLLGPFAIEANVGRPIPIAVRSRKARGLVAYLAMQPDYRARREELATLLWGDGPDEQARHSLRQCLIALRQDLSAASEILLLDREAIGLDAQFLSVDARNFISYAQTSAPEALMQAAALWRGGFLPDIVLAIEEFDTWQRQESDRLAAAAGDVFAVLCRNADANGDGEGAIAAAERLIVLEPTREDRQRIALKLFARHKGRDAALSRAKLLTDLLRSELDVAPEAATRALIAAIKRGDFEPAHVANREHSPAPSVANPVSVPDMAPVSLTASERKESSVPGIVRAFSRTGARQYGADQSAVLVAATAFRCMDRHRHFRNRRDCRARAGTRPEIVAGDDRSAARPRRRGAALCRRYARATGRFGIRPGADA